MGRRASSTRWLSRQNRDPYVALARRDGYRSRAAYKLIEIDDRFHLLRPGRRVVDLGAAPGSWTQVAVQRAGAGVVAVDLSRVRPVEGAEVLTADVRDPGLPAVIRHALAGDADLVLSDLAPAATGDRGTDHLRSLALVETALALAASVLRPAGALVVKVLQGAGERDLVRDIGLRFRSVRRVKPMASRDESAELYIVAIGYRGPKGVAD